MTWSRQIEAIYGATPGPVSRYSPAERTGGKKARVEGYPDTAHVSMSHVERQNLPMRMHMLRLIDAFSEKVENHAYAVALHDVYDNLVRLHGKLRITPAMAAGIAGRLWQVFDIVALVEAAEGPAAKRGSSKKLETAEAQAPPACDSGRPRVAYASAEP